MTITTLNALPEAEFIGALGGIYESSPWVAEAAAAGRPFDDATALEVALRDTVDRADSARQLDLINAHPDLGGNLARAGALTPESTGEQSRLGLDRLAPEEFALFDQLNADYRTRFGFPFIICVALVDKPAILAAFRARLDNTPAQEQSEALRQIHLIAAGRLADLLER